IRLQREDPANGLKDSPRARNRSGLSTDYFAPEAAGVASIRIDGFTTLLFRVGFSGDTATLRDFVEGLRQVALPIVIHEISVDSRRAEASGEPATRGLADLFREDA